MPGNSAERWALLCSGLLLLPAASCRRQATGLGYERTGSSIIVHNSRIQFSLDTRTGAIRSISFDGNDLLGTDGSGYVDFDLGRDHLVVGGSDREETLYHVERRGDSIDLSLFQPALKGWPMAVEQHYVLREGEQGIHLYASASVPLTTRPAIITQGRFVLRLDPQKFTEGSIEDDRSVILPTPGELIDTRIVSDATYDLTGLKSRYPYPYYTKYDWIASEQDHRLHGLLGSANGVYLGAWILQANKESLNGGPRKQELTVHQTTKGPVIIATYTSIHFGSKEINALPGWSKLFGPYYLYFNSSAGTPKLRSDASGLASPLFGADLYDRLNVPGWVPPSSRGSVAGTFRVPNGRSSRSVIVLAQNSQAFESSATAYQYWTSTAADGSFRLTSVRPGAYRLSAYSPGVFGEFIHDDVTVSAGATAQLPGLSWTPEAHGTTLWTIGIPDRTSAEFHNGGNTRPIGKHLDYAGELPSQVDYCIGESTPERDWNYVQYGMIGNNVQPPWRIRFTLPKEPSDGASILTVALASAESPGLEVTVNGGPPLIWNISRQDFSSVARRSGNYGFHLEHQFTFDAHQLHAGENAILLRVQNGGGKNLLYDALRLEISPSVSARDGQAHQPTPDVP